MKVNGNFSDTKLERLQSIRKNRVMSPSDAVDLETWVAPVTAYLNFRWFTDTFLWWCNFV